MLRAMLVIALPILAEAWAGPFCHLQAPLQSGRASRCSHVSKRASLSCSAGSGSESESQLLTEEQRQSFWRHGFVMVSDILTQQEADECRRRYEPMFAGKCGNSFSNATCAGLFLKPNLDFTRRL